MKLSFVLVLPILLCAACQSTSSSSKANPPPPVESAPLSAEHVWLQQLVGEWKVHSSADMGPEQPPMEFDSSLRVRSLGGLWVLGEGSADMDGTPFASVMTLGYDPAKQHFVGTWIDTIQTTLWTYRGSLDEARKTLTLEAEGPAFDDPSKLATYRDAIEIVDANHKRMTSSVRNPDGTWTSFMQAEYTRVK